MKKYLTYLFMLMCPMLFADEPSAEIDEMMIEEIAQEIFCVTVSDDEAKVIEELVSTMGNTSVFSLAFKKPYLRKLAKGLRPVSSTQFLGYVFERPHLIKCMKKISKSSIKWNSLTRSIVRGLKKEAVDSLFEDIPTFAKHTKGNQSMLTYLAKQEDWDGFIRHLVAQN